MCNAFTFVGASRDCWLPSVAAPAHRARDEVQPGCGNIFARHLACVSPHPPCSPVSPLRSRELQPKEEPQGSLLRSVQVRRPLPRVLWRCPPRAHWGERPARGSAGLDGGVTSGARSVLCGPGEAGRGKRRGGHAPLGFAALLQGKWQPAAGC